MNAQENTMTAQITSTWPDRPGRRKAVSLSALAGIGYAATWIISLSVGAPNPSVAASGSQVVAAIAGRSGPTLAMYALAEGVAAIALVAVMTAAARAARCCGQARAGLAAVAFGIAVAAVSWAELALGIWLISGPVPDRRTVPAGAIYHAIMRMDGAKMFLLGAMALAISQLARRSPILPGWLAPLGALLAAALVTSGLGYLLLTPGLASTVYVSGLLLLIFVSATGIALRSHDVFAIRTTRSGRPSSAPPFKPATSIPLSGAAVPVRAADAELVRFPPQTAQLLADSPSSAEG
jgi:hypothetical protein